ncbi:hypothetical protein OKW34_000032 [Paraburkholderia youngii]
MGSDRTRGTSDDASLSPEQGNEAFTGREDALRPVPSWVPGQPRPTAPPVRSPGLASPSRLQHSPGLDAFTGEPERTLDGTWQPPVPSDAGALLEAPSGRLSTRATSPSLPTSASSSDAAAQTSAAAHAPSESASLLPLGYTQEQILKLKPRSLSEIVEYHDRLAEHGFTPTEICRISDRWQSLEVVARRYRDLVAALPDLTHSQIVAVARQRSGNLTLEALWPIAADLAGGALRLNTSQIAEIAQHGGRTAIGLLHLRGREFTRAPLNLAPQQLVAIARNRGGGEALWAVMNLLPVLREPPYGLDTGQVVAVANKRAGGEALWAVRDLLPALLALGLNKEEVVALAIQGNGKQALEAAKEELEAITLSEADFNLLRELMEAAPRQLGGGSGVLSR